MILIYPQRLVPQIHDTIVVSPNLNEYLCRWVDANIQVKLPNNELNPEVFPKESARMDGLSVNKIPPSEVSDILIKINKEYEDFWEVGTTGQTPKEQEFTIEQRNYFF